MNYNYKNTLKNVIQRMKSEQRGQNTLEFGFAIVILLSITFGMIDFGRAVYTKSVIDAASQEGARKGIVTMQNSGVDVAITEAAVLDRMFGLDTDSATVDVVQNDPEVVDVTVTYDFRLVTPLAAAVLGGNGGAIQIVSTASMLAQ